MTDDHFDALLDDAAKTYNRPPDVVPLDDMWHVIERASFGPDHVHTPDSRVANARSGWVRRVAGNRVLQAAALVVLGIGIGRLSVEPRDDVALSEVPVVDVIEGVPYAYAPVTDRYLGQAVALLIDLPRELRVREMDSRFVSGARELLLQTRLLLDSPAISDPSLRVLLEDLEVVLVQLVRLQADPDPVKVDLLQESLQESDVIPRLRSAVADYITE